MADSKSPESEPTMRTLLRHVLDSAVPRTPRRPRSARVRNQSSQTKATARRHSRGARATGRRSHVKATGRLEEQTPRTLLRNILLTAPESSIVVPNSVTMPVPAPEVVRLSRRESSQGSLELRLPELEPPKTPAPVLLAPGRKKPRLRLSLFQQEVDQGLPLSPEPHGTADASSLTSSSLNLTFGTSLRSQSVQRPGLARRPLTRRAVDVGAFLQDLGDTSEAMVSPGDSYRTPVALLAKDAVLEDTQPFSPPLVGCSPRGRRSLPCRSDTGAADAGRAVGRRTWSGPALQNSPREPTQLPAGRSEEVNTLAVGFPNPSSGDSGEDGVEPLEGEGEAGENTEEGAVNVGAVEAAAGMQGSARTAESEGCPEVTEADGAVEAEEPEGSSGDKDTSSRTASPQVASGALGALQAQRRHQFLEPVAPPAAAGLCAEPLSARLPPRPRTAGPRPRQDPYKAGLSHYAKLFSFYAKMPVEKKALEMVEKCLDRYFQHLCNDLDVFAAHAGRKTVRPEDLELLMRRQGLVTDQVSLHLLVERYLPLEYRQLLIPCAFSGNSVFPAQ
ncbi:centromere protein T [Orycteropus afer afer]|uniref:Centromere protein T n=1 Tax=Orycteropus afer afer TaxID=1230840 RepID=A0AC54Z254_ORYAF|nr:centromere protein T [Orycteropus afer afer]